MSTHDELKIMYKNHKYSEICTIYDQFANIEDYEPSEWDFVYFMNSLYKEKRYADCLVIYKACKRLYKNFDMLNQKMGWCVYHVYLKNYDFKNNSCEDFFAKIDYVLKNVTDEKYSPMWCLVNLATKAILHKEVSVNPDYARANSYLELIDPNNLTRVERKLSDSKGKSRSMASDCETWYSRKTKSLFGMGNWQECIKTCEKGLSSYVKFHNNNDSWFKYRMAISLLKLGKVEESMLVAQEILNLGFKHWSIYQLLYDIAVEKNDIDSAMKYAGCCALADPSHEMRINFYKSYADFLEKQNFMEESMLHLHLVILIKQEKAWKLKDETRWEISDEIASINKKETLQRLQIFWKKHRDKDKVYVDGIISKLLPSGKDGFVKDDKEKEYYFNFRAAACNHNKLIVGTPVKFVLGERLDKKKNVWKMNAIEIKLK